ncbi:MAG: hypothetical protein CSYNP_03953 [Syntrophus sp. SKADARSKE-3]|nr:hypothetical protein [Syntrophus sp. SKADARSKE-3]
MGKHPNSALTFSIILVVMLLAICTAKAVTDDRNYDAHPPFKLTLLEPYKAGPAPTPEETSLYNPRNPYNIFINYELGMHCVGFDISYCCIIL